MYRAEVVRESNLCWLSAKVIFIGSSHCRSSHPEVFRKKVFLKFRKFTGKHLCQSLYFNKVAGRSYLIKLQASGLRLYQKKTLPHAFSCEFCEISKNTCSGRIPPGAASDTAAKILLVTFLAVQNKECDTQR